MVNFIISKNQEGNSERKILFDNMYRFPISPLSQKIRLESKEDADSCKIYGSFLTSPNWFNKKGIAPAKQEKREGYQSTLANSFGLTKYTKDGSGHYITQNHTNIRKKSHLLNC